LLFKFIKKYYLTLCKIDIRVHEKIIISKLYKKLLFQNYTKNYYFKIIQKIIILKLHKKLLFQNYYFKIIISKLLFQNYYFKIIISKLFQFLIKIIIPNIQSKLLYQLNEKLLFQFLIKIIIYNVQSKLLFLIPNLNYCINLMKNYYFNFS
jgi:hypothetical protein